MSRRKKIETELLKCPEASPEARGSRVKRVRNMANLSRQQMSEGVEININSLKGWEIGRYGGLTSCGAEKIIQRVSQEGVQCTLDWLMYGIGAGPTAQTGLNDTKSAISPPQPTLQTTSTDEDIKIANELMLFKQHYHNAIDFIVADDGMLPIYNIGEYVAGVKLSADKIDTAIGLSCIIQMENGNVLIRQLRKGSGQNIYTLTCTNVNTQIEKPTLYDVNIISVAPIIFHRKKYFP